MTEQQKAKTCQKCGATYYNKHKTSRFCSPECQHKAQIIPRTPCPVCGKMTESAGRKYCSVECQHKAAAVPRLKKRQCEQCGKEFQPYEAVLRFCSRRCASTWSGLQRRKAHTNVYGYRMLYRPGHPMASRQGYIMEHRLVMSEAIGRMLTGSEVVHHVNGNKADNRLENLVVMSNAQHSRLPKGERKTLVCCPHCGGKIRLSNAVRSVAAE